MSTPRIGETALARGVTATWWYTAVGVAFFVALTALFWILWAWAAPALDAPWRFPLSIAGSVAWIAASILLLLDYRPSVLAARDGERHPPSTLTMAGFVLAVLGALLLGLGTSSLLAAAAVVAFVLSVRPWTPGVRWRVVVGATLLVLVLVFVEASAFATQGIPVSAFSAPAFFVLMVPSMTAFSLWWWEIVLELDWARTAESQLAATRERLRLANDVHDLQGHHLQVIALQLELAERLLTKDPAAAAEQIRAAQGAVNEARAGTRALATSFRGVPLPDELENAADLLRAAGHDVRMHVGAGAASAPADVLGPIVRESVTNVLKHGDGARARIDLSRDGDTWVYRMVNDAAGHDGGAGGVGGAEGGADVAWGSGLTGMGERLEVSGGKVEAWNDGTSFTVQVRLPVVHAPVAGTSDLPATTGEHA
ncbi:MULTISPECIES: sensor histidine kinase [unclassified Pseudoclavibacter]|uniref:sensor histidine kinase n=1 Tax=unclassified Pseudoclavibacter TaxID=2615177 RepID=UPI001BA798DC|nr:histidine kinase [Pseudoclavibacter sp. Marseille-Q4354]MBS3179153.1 histidine kinase [Pseudoclavibacter sp. Marseille-Q4354]